MQDLVFSEKAVRVDYLGSGKYRMSIDGSSYVVSGRLVRDNNVRHLTASVDGSCSNARVVLHDRDLHVFTQVRIIGVWTISLTIVKATLKPSWPILV